jgi:N-acetylmuramidase
MTNLIPANFKGKAKKLDDVDLPRVAMHIGAGEDEVHMLIEVETLGSGFDKSGRPIMLFEPHVFHRNLAGMERQTAVNAGLAYAKWGARPYPRDSYPRLLQAMKINEKEALKSCSWGMGQIMGGHYKMLGYETVQEMVAAFADDEDNHLEGMIAFIKASGIDDELRVLAHKKGPTVPEDCAVIARVYNGAGYRVNRYHIKMATAHNKWRGIKDTPYSPAPPAPLAPKVMTPAVVVAPTPPKPVVPVPATPAVVVAPLPPAPKPIVLPEPRGFPANPPKYSFWQWLVS